MIILVPVSKHVFFFFFRFLIAGRRPDETVAALVVGHARAGPYPPAHAQQLGQRGYVAQRTKVRSARARSARRHVDGRLFRPCRGQVAGAQV